MTESRECILCHRIGYRGFVPSGESYWVCYRDDVCRKRRVARAWREIKARWGTR